jgi:two-component system, LytTR family, response regulator LytT
VTPLRVLIVEDEWLARNYLVRLLQQTERAEVVAAVSSIEEAEQALAPQAGASIGAVFVDVRLRSPQHDDAGMVWIRSLAQSPEAPLFVLATAHKQHAVEAFDLGVVDFLLKPFTAARVSACLDRLLERRCTVATSKAVPLRMAARRDRAIVFLDLNEVWACEAAERLTFVHSSRGRFDLDLTLSAIAVSFGRTLLRVHRNWLINPPRVLELSRAEGETILLLGSTEATSVEVPVAKERAPAIREALLSAAPGVRHR